MKAVISNSSIKIIDPTPVVESEMSVLLAYKDKSKEYQLKKMSKNPFSRGTKLYTELLASSSGSLLVKEENILIIPPGFSEEIISLIPEIEDIRKDTGTIISLPWVDYTFTKRPLRDYQQEAVEELSKRYRGIMNFATGLGKTLTAIHLIRHLKRKTLVVCPNKSVAYQFKEELEKAFSSKRVGFIGDSIYKPADITVGIAASINNRIKEISKLDLGVVVFDEAHHTPANTFFKIAQELGNVGRMYGLTATSFRSDGKDIFIKAGCGDIVVQRDVAWGVSTGWLAKPYFLVREVATAGTDHDDKLKAYKTHVLKCKEMLQRIEMDAKNMMAAGKATLILVDQVEHGEMLSKALNIPFAKGTDDASEEYVKQLNASKIIGLIGTEGKLGEGTDTRNVDCLILANFAGSKGLVLQAVGRGLRKQGDKTSCIILDYIPTGSTMLKRHAQNRIKWYREITPDVKILK